MSPGFAVFMNLGDLRRTGHWPTLLSAFLYFDLSFMVWTVLGPLAAQIGESLKLSPDQKGLMVAVPILAGAILRIALGLLVDRIGAKNTGILAQLVVIAGLLAAWFIGLNSFAATLALGAILGFAGASFAVALPQAGRWYPPNLQGMVLGLAGAGNIGVVLDSLFAPRLATVYGWRNVFGLAVIPAVVVLVIYVLVSRESPRTGAPPKRLGDYLALLRDQDAHWFCFYYTVSFGGFVGLASSYVLIFKDQFSISPINAGDLAAVCTFVGAVLRPIGGGAADRFGGIRVLHWFYFGAALFLIASIFCNQIATKLLFFAAASGALGMANGAVFQLLPQRFSKEIGLMTGLVGAGGGIGGFYLASSLGYSKVATGSFTLGFLIFAALCLVALGALGLVKSRWRNTWGAVANARI
jgi:MFS transporter, NNP family, nitrate/nitrite transporter